MILVRDRLYDARHRLKHISRLKQGKKSAYRTYAPGAYIGFRLELQLEARVPRAKDRTKHIKSNKVKLLGLCGVSTFSKSHPL